MGSLCLCGVLTSNRQLREAGKRGSATPESELGVSQFMFMGLSGLEDIWKCPAQLLGLRGGTKAQTGDLFPTAGPVFKEQNSHEKGSRVPLANCHVLVQFLLISRGQAQGPRRRRRKRLRSCSDHRSTLAHLKHLRSIPQSGGGHRDRWLFAALSVGSLHNVSAGADAQVYFRTPFTHD